MSAIFSASGKEFAAEAFLAESCLRRYADAWKAGAGRHKTNGFQVAVVDDDDLGKQITAVIGFVQRFLPELKRLKDFPGVESSDFRVAYFWQEEAAALTCTLPEELHVALAHARATLTFCVYPCCKEEPVPEPTALAVTPAADAPSGPVSGRGSS